MKLRLSILLVGLLLLPMLHAGITAPAAVDAQGNQPRNCPQLVRVAEEELVLNCANQPFDTACYGYQEVIARLDADPDKAPDEDFEPGSWTRLSEYASVSASAMNVSEALWGLASLKVQANIPRGLGANIPADPGVLFMLFGEAEVESAVPDDLLFIPVDEPLAVTVATATDVKEEASASAETLGSAAAGMILLADGVSPDGEWVRVAYELQGGWVLLEDLAAVDVSDLPEIGPDSLSPMQAFYLRTGSRALQCNQAVPAMLLMQSPADVMADLTIDGVDIRLDSATVVARIIGNTLLFQVINGYMVIYPDTPNEVIVPAGFNYPTCQLTPPEQLDGWDDDPNDQIADCVGGQPVPFTNADRQEIQSLERLPDNLFYYRIRIPRVVRGSGVGGPIDRVIIDPTSPAYDRIIRNCELGRIPPAVCEHLVGYTP